MSRRFHYTNTHISLAQNTKAKHLIPFPRFCLATIEVFGIIEAENGDGPYLPTGRGMTNHYHTFYISVKSHFSTTSLCPQHSPFPSRKGHRGGLCVGSSIRLIYGRVPSLNRDSLLFIFPSFGCFKLPRFYDLYPS